MIHKPLRVFDGYLFDYQNSLEERTKAFERDISNQSRGEGMMMDDVYALAKHYDIELPNDLLDLL